jgi:hypothetical protein
MSETITNRERLIYIGRGLTSTNKLFYIYRDEKGVDVSFSKKLKGNENIGNILEVTRKDEKTYAAPYDIVDSHKDQQSISKWQNNDRLVSAKQRTTQDIIKSNRDYYEESLRGLRDIYKNVARHLRDTFILKLVMDLKK